MLASYTMQSSILEDVFSSTKPIKRSIRGVKTMQKDMKRITITLPDQTANELEDWANQQGRPTANLAAYLVEQGMNQAREKEQYTPSESKKVTKAK
jgi:hypothetical protein